MGRKHNRKKGPAALFRAGRTLAAAEPSVDVRTCNCEIGIYTPCPVHDAVSGYKPPLTHRPSRLDAAHTACGLRLTPAIHLHLGDGETCEQCTHVVAQVASALKGEPSWAQSTK